MKRAAIEADTFPLAEMISGLNFLLLTIFGGHFVINDQITLGTFMALQWYIFGLIWPIRFAGWLVNLLQQALASAPRIFEILDTAPEIYDMPEAEEIEEMEGHVVIEGVSYSFPDGTPGLKNINLEVPPGEIVAIIGGTGSGKSTLIGVLPRFYDPDSGKILIDGIDIKSIKLSNLRSHIGMVMQETFYFQTLFRKYCLWKT